MGAMTGTRKDKKEEKHDVKRQRHNSDVSDALTVSINNESRDSDETRNQKHAMPQSKSKNMTKGRVEPPIDQNKTGKTKEVKKAKEYKKEESDIDDSVMDGKSISLDSLGNFDSDESAAHDH